MKISLAWLSDYVDLPADTAALCELLTFAGIEVEGVQVRGVAMDHVVVGQIVASEKHPGADRLSVCRVEDGSGTPRQIVCGAKNYALGDKVPLALPGAVLPGDFRIKVGRLRGVESQGMLCSAKELALAEEAEGLLILPREAEIGTPIGELFPPDTVIEIEITPNRPDLLSHVGIAREIAALTGVPLRVPAARAGAITASTLSVASIDPEGCPLYTARRIRGVRVAPSPEWLRRRLESVGLRPINNIVDVTNFVLLELGQPLHAFDGATLAGPIHARRAVEGEKFLALDGREYALRNRDLVIADAGGPVAIAGVMGGARTGVTESTTEVVLESARFLPSAIRRTSRELGLISDSSYRFERGVDPASVETASERATSLILELAGGSAQEGAAVTGGMEIPVVRAPFRYARCSALIGDVVTPVEADRVLSGFGLRKVGGDDVEAQWEIPGFRADLAREVDLIEEVARSRRIDRLPPGHARRVAEVSESDRDYDFRLALARRLAAMGYSEARTMSLVSPSTLSLDPSGSGSCLELRNPLGEDYSRLRPSLIPGLLRIAAANARQGAGQIRLFEIGRVFGGEPEEEMRLAVVLTGPVGVVSWRAARQRASDFHDAKGLIEAVIAATRSEMEPEFERFDDPAMALAVRVVLDGRPVGRIVQVLPSMAREMDVTGALLAAEIALDALRPADGGGLRYRPVERFPAVVRDIALMVPREVSHARVIEAVRWAGEALLAEVAVFDVFEDPSGERVPADRKSLAYTLTYRASGRTLTAEEANAAHARIKQVVVEATGAVFRE